MIINYLTVDTNLKGIKSKNQKRDTQIKLIQNPIETFNETPSEFIFCFI